MIRTVEDPFHKKDRFIGAYAHSGGTRFRLWAPTAKSVAVLFEGRDVQLPLEAEGDGYFSGTFREVPCRQPISIQPRRRSPVSRSCLTLSAGGPDGPSEIIDPAAYAWSEIEASWPGISIEGQVLYELHVGTFTPEGSFLSAIRQFPRLRDLGITVLECMPLAEFAGGWAGATTASTFSRPFTTMGPPTAFAR